ncbi:MAG TPA: pyridoxamine 5'-phosphate oxidase [Gemmatimonadaceae bacterium]|jgi:pyridoxamine 5'-phosphate oxidase|nr:pyridoxamine 5'-phosphate oxidase [Gemmatimonadaceae bacterium]
MTSLDLAALRRDYALASLTETDVNADPIRQFEAWFADAIAAQVLEPNAMTLATATTDGVPSARIVLLKGVDGGGFVFFTDYRSRKGAELAENPLAALVFLWKEIERQVRVSGAVSRVTVAESEAYFRSRPLGSRLGAWVSHQSSVLASRAEIEERWQTVSERFADGDVPLPPHWGGYRVVPDEIEFWQGRPNRLHDRLRYERTPSGWTIARLSP